MPEYGTISGDQLARTPVRLRLSDSTLVEKFDNRDQRGGGIFLRSEGAVRPYIGLERLRRQCGGIAGQSGYWLRRMARALGSGEFEAVVRRHQAMVFSVAYHLLHDRALAEEVAQDVFLQLYGYLAELKSDEHVVFWLRKVAVHRAIDCARSRGVRAEVSLDDHAAELADESFANEGHDPLLKRRLRQLVASLPQKARAAVVLRYQEDLGPEEIAKVLEMPVATVKSHLQRALAMLREKMSRMEVKR
jgi:RNA polymerase sigma-70 factor, ECF subfamily